MGNTLTSSKGGPVFTNTPTQTVVDLNALRLWLEKYTFRRADVASVRAGLTGAELFVGLEFYETDTGYTYLNTSGGWTRTAGPVAACRLVKSTAGVTGAGAFGFAALAFDLEDFDPLDMHPAANPTRIVAPVAGYYAWALQYTGNSASVGYGVRLAKNGSVVEGSETWNPSLGANGLATPTSAGIILLAANDYLEMQAGCVTSAQNVATVAGHRPVFSVNLVGAA